MRLIPLTKGQFAQVSDHRYEELVRSKWQAHWDSDVRSYYARRTIVLDNGKHRDILMHRMILGLDYGDTRIGDHKNHNTLDNTDSNLVIVSSAGNSQNKRLYRNNKSGHAGVYFYKPSKKWLAYISDGGKYKHLGYFSTFEEALTERLKAEHTLGYTNCLASSGLPKLPYEELISGEQFCSPL